MQPSYGDLKGYQILAYRDLRFDDGGGARTGTGRRVSRQRHGKYAYTSNYQGFKILDVSNPTKPRVISRVRNQPVSSVQSQYIDVSGDLLIVNQEGLVNFARDWQGGIRLFDIGEPEHPQEVGFFRADQTRLEGEGETLRAEAAAACMGSGSTTIRMAMASSAFACTS